METCESQTSTKVKSNNVLMLANNKAIEGRCQLYCCVRAVGFNRVQMHIIAVEATVTVTCRESVSTSVAKVTRVMLRRDSGKRGTLLMRKENGCVMSPSGG